MKAVIFSDGDARTGLSEDLEARIAGLLRDNGDQLQVIGLERGKVAPCRGCFLCATLKYRGGCVNGDVVGQAKKELPNTDLTVYITPVVFGHYSSAVKNAVDRGGGSRRWQVVIGYGSDIDEEERSTFIDLTARHCGAADIVHPGMVAKADVYVTQSREENATICARIREGLRLGRRA